MKAIHYRTEDGVIGYAEGDILVNELGECTRVVRDGRGLTLQPAHAEGASRCDGCGSIEKDIDVGFNLGLQEYRHDCGGRWRSGRLHADGRFDQDEPERPEPADPGF